MVPTFRIEPGACFLLALGLLILPLPLIGACILAALFHEACHWLAAKAMQVPVYGISISLLGCRMGTGTMGRTQELICAAAGPLGSLLLCAFIPVFPLTGFCAAIQGFYNLLPLYPMDGGRILRCLAGERITEIVSKCIVFSSLLLFLLLLLIPDSGMIPKFICLIPVFTAWKAKNSLQTTETKSTIALPNSKR